MPRFPELDGFQLLSGIASTIAGPVMLIMGAPAGWSFLIMSAGICVLLAQWALVREIRFEVPDATMVALGFAGIVCVGVAVVYLTRAANDLPSAFPGYDRDSENFSLLPGILSLTVGAVALARAIASVHPSRAQDRRRGA
jgi:hypothetical protein